MKVNWFSPLGPAKTDIANYTARLLPYLSRYAEVELWTDQLQWDKSLETFARVKSYEQGKIPWEDLNRSDITVFNIGNNSDFHGSIWEIGHVHSGVVILHDTSLHDFFAGFYLCKRRDTEGYLNLMHRHYGRSGLEAARAFLTGSMPGHYMADHYPLTRACLENASGVVVHTKEAFDSLTKKNRWPVCHLPLPLKASVCDTSGDGRTCRGLTRMGETGVCRLIVFGYIGLNRCMDLLLQVLSEFSDRDKFQLDVYGALEERTHIVRRIGELGLKKNVQLHGFVTEKKLTLALNLADMAINLRYPTMGEASGSQLRIWNHALPSIVTKTGWYASLPEEVVCFVRPGSEKEDIHRLLTSFLENPEMYKIMGKKGYDLLVKNHDPEAYVSGLMAFFSGARAFLPEVEAFNLAARAAQELSCCTVSEESPLTCGQTAQTIHAIFI